MFFSLMIFFLWHIGCLGGLFNFQMFMNVLDLFLLLISHYIPVSLKKIVCIFPVTLRWLSLVLWSKMRFILESIPCVFEKDMYVLCCWIKCSVCVWFVLLPAQIFCWHPKVNFFLSAIHVSTSVFLFHLLL